MAQTLLWQGLKKKKKVSSRAEFSKSSLSILDRLANNGLKDKSIISLRVWTLYIYAYTLVFCSHCPRCSTSQYLTASWNCPRNLKKVPKPGGPSDQWNQNPWGGPRHQQFLKFSMWFQWPARVEHGCSKENHRLPSRTFKKETSKFWKLCTTELFKYD